MARTRGPSTEPLGWTTGASTAKRPVGVGVDGAPITARVLKIARSPWRSVTLRAERSTTIRSAGAGEPDVVGLDPAGAARGHPLEQDLDVVALADRGGVEHEQDVRPAPVRGVAADEVERRPAPGMGAGVRAASSTVAV